MSASPTQPAHPPASGLGRRLLANSAWNFAAFAVYMTVLFFSARLYIRYLGLKEYGLLVLLGSIVAPLGLLNFGMGKATVKYMAESLGRGRRDEAEHYLGNTLLFNGMVGAFGAALMAALAPVLARHVFKIDPADTLLTITAIRWMAASWAVSQVSATLVAVPTAMQRFNIVSTGGTIFSTANILTGIFALSMGGGLLTVIRIRLLWEVMTAVGWAAVARRLLPGVSLRPTYHRRAFGNSLRFGVWETSANVGGLLANQTDKFLLGVYVSTGAVGLFNVPVLVFSAVYGAVGKLADALFPAMSDLHGREDYRRLTSVLLYSGWLITLLMVASQAALFIFAGDILRIYLGHEVPRAASTVLRISAIAAVISAPSVVVYQYLLGMGKTRWVAIQAFASGIVNLAGGLILVPRYGLSGAAWSDLLAIVLTRPAIHYLVWRSGLSEQVDSKTFFSALYGVGLLAAPMVLGLDAIRSRFGPVPGLTALCLLMILAGALIGGFCLLAGRLFATHREMLSRFNRQVVPLLLGKLRSLNPFRGGADA